MKKIYISIAAVLISAWSYAQTSIVEWTFPDASADLIADGGIAENLNQEIYTEGGTSNIQFKNGFEDKAAQATSWEDGAGLKAWVVSFTTVGYGDLQLSSLQSSGGNDPGPRDFKVQYKIGINGEWTDIPGGEIEVQNDWTTGVLDGLDLPAECNNKPTVFVRWIMTSNTNSIGNTVESTGKSKIDNILVTGHDNTGLAEEMTAEMNIFPNPCQGTFTLTTSTTTTSVEVFNTSGQLVFTDSSVFSGRNFNVSHLDQGLYLLILKDESGKKIGSKKLLIR